ncbi:MAG: helicase [Bacteroidetes bacterium]|nr:helicase [Bacteroidota bacterium]
MKEKIQETLAGLKDFQLKTVDYVFKQLYVKGRGKMLIADEVGLGKTIVAKGIIAKAFGQFTPTPNKKVFNVIYICSNQALARQNLKKLNFSGDNLAIDYSEDDDRLTGLAYISAKEEQQFPFRIKSFTPATSFDDKTHAGKADERVLLYRLLYSYSDFKPLSNSLKWILKGNRRIKDENWEARIEYAEELDTGKEIAWLKKIRPKVYSEFKKALDKTVCPADLPKSFNAAGVSYPVKYWTLLKNLCQLGIRKNNYYHYNFSKELISSLRFLLSRVCIEFLQADIFILDEFQRYKKLIDKTGGNEEDDKEAASPAIQLARDIFSIEDSKILMLSATPFKPYTNDFDELNGEVHYNEFITVLQFLMADKAAEFWKEYEHDRKALFGFLRHPDTLDAQMHSAIGLKNKLETLYRTSIVRTEKLLASNDRDALIKHVNKPISIQPEDINDFVVLDQITLLLNKDHKESLPVPLEYVKSCPFALSFLDNYQHKEKIRNLILENAALQQLVKQTKHGWVNLKDINDYKPLIPPRAKSLPNAKLRLLLDETVHNNGWKYLWIPPSIPYYELDGAFKDSWGYSKTLIFSSWKLVPRMVASLVSYEAERLSIGNPKSISDREKKEKENFQPYYFQKRRSPRPQFTFKVLKEEQEPQQMNNFILSYPCLFLANLYDPAINVAEKKSVQQIKAEIKSQLMATFKRLNLNQYVSGEGDWQKWYWLGPLLLDKASENNKVLTEWLLKGIPPSELSIDAESIGADKDESIGRKTHFELAKAAFTSHSPIAAGKLSNEQLEVICEHMAELTIGSPAICYLRSQRRYKELSNDLFDAAFNVCSAFLTMFNKPESIAIVRLHTKDGDYWERALRYMIDGNMQAMLDEFVYLLINGENIQSTNELSDFISDILSVRTATSDIEDYPTFLDNLTKEKPKRKAIRSHYAVDFGTQKINTAKGAGRQINIRQAFNSPFRPFVLASTSIGQEGLDFHLYCKKIFHWNLPSNPIDFEQREGRIHRYQGLVIRLNLSSKYKDEITYNDDSNNIWRDLFLYAAKEKKTAKFPCDLIPFWHTDSLNDIKIERFVPLYPFSSDIEKFNNLIKVLAFYRLTFGQPRQGELVDALHSSGFSDDSIKKLDVLIINLSPIKFLC